MAQVLYPPKRVHEGVQCGPSCDGVQLAPRLQCLAVWPLRLCAMEVQTERRSTLLFYYFGMHLLDTALSQRNKLLICKQWHRLGHAHSCGTEHEAQLV